MIRMIVIVAAFAFSPVCATADELKLKELASGSIADETVQKAAPADGVIASKVELEKLCKAWKIDAPKVDFKESLVLVGTWKGTSFSVEAMSTDGDLKVRFLGTKDLRDGFRYHIMLCPRAGIKTVGGKALAGQSD